MFAFASSFNGDVSTWNMSNIRSCDAMFKDCVSFTGNLDSWDVSNVGGFRDMFNGAALFTGEGLAYWNVSNKLYDSAYMFMGASSFNGNISSWDVSGVRFMQSMVRSELSFQCS